MIRTNKILVAVVAVFVLFATAATASAAVRSLTASESCVLRAMNGARRSHGLAALRVDYRLERVARVHSVDMLRHRYFSHGNFAARVRTWPTTGPIFGENLAWGPANASWVVSQWLASPAHRANLLRPGFRRVGVSTVSGTFSGMSGALVVTADFAGT